MIELKTSEEIKRMREAGRICALCMEEILSAVRPGITTKELDDIAYDFTVKHHGVPSFLNYNGYPGSICASINEEIVHGIPSARKLNEGDIISIDMGIKLHGYHSDMARTVPVGKTDPESLRLIEVTKKSFFEGLKFVREGYHINDIGIAVQKYVEAAGFSVVRDLIGHGVGRELHESPDVPNYATHRKGPALRKGMTIAIEPMVNAGDWRVEVLDDEWTVVSADMSRSAHYENTVAVTSGDPIILTQV
ncbi:MAG: type I methionyl aminopeptidase [Clostridiales bacterium]|nr:type I methionyl aminopeptidase [Clostridiales bacterium]